MVQALTIDVAIPAYNEADSIGRVLRDLPRPPVRRVIVGDNNSTDDTAAVARELGAIVVPAAVQGYGSACLAALAEMAKDPPDIVVFIDADYSDHPQQLTMLIEPILSGRAELVIGSRTLKKQPKGALLPQAIFGNWLSCSLIRLIWGVRFSDLGPFRAVTWRALTAMAMEDPNFGWTVEMQVKAARDGITSEEVAVDYRPRIGKSKITGTLRGTVKAGWKILYTIARYGIMSRRKAYRGVASCTTSP